MLRLLTITDFAIIRRLELDLGPGFNVLTGETGAGKSIIIDALGMLVGARAEASWVRAGARQARVEGVFVLSGETLEGLTGALQEQGIEAEGGELIIAREINPEGRNLCRINGQIVPARFLTLLGEGLVDIHGQGQHLSLFRVREHLNLLDRFSGLEAERERLAESVAAYRSLQKELDGLRRGKEQAAREADLLSFQVREIQDARLRPGEEEDLLRERLVGANAQKLQALSEQAYQVLAAGQESRGAALDLLAEAAGALAQVEKTDAGAGEMRRAAESLAEQADDLARAIRRYAEGLEFDPARLDAIEERLEAIAALKRKYGGTVERAMAFAAEGARRLQSIAGAETRTAELEAQGQALLATIGERAGALSAARRSAAVRLAAAVQEGLADLAMPAARVEVRLDRREAPDGAPLPGGGRYAFGPSGIDEAQIMLSANPGEPLRPLAQAASGGEASRLMLAIKSALVEADPVPTLVFDEIDSGVGGRVGGAVGKRLRETARSHQVLCVTHLPQIAAMADRHYRVAKDVSGRETRLSVDHLSGEGRVEELRAMLGTSGEAAREAARELLRGRDP